MFVDPARRLALFDRLASLPHKKFDYAQDDTAKWGSWYSFVCRGSSKPLPYRFVKKFSRIRSRKDSGEMVVFPDSRGRLSLQVCRKDFACA